MTKEWTWQAEREALVKRVRELEDALMELTVVAERALKLSQDYGDFKLYGMEPMWRAISNARSLTNATKKNAQP